MTTSNFFRILLENFCFLKFGLLNSECGLSASLNGICLIGNRESSKLTLGYGSWNPERGIRNPLCGILNLRISMESTIHFGQFDGIRGFGIRNPRFGIRNPESRIRDPQSRGWDLEFSDLLNSFKDPPKRHSRYNYFDVIPG